MVPRGAGYPWEKIASNCAFVLAMYANFYTHRVYVFCVKRNHCEILCVLQAVYSNILGRTNG